MSALQRLHAYLRDGHVPHALIGGHALAARGYARFTLDVDILTTDKAVLREEFWNELRRDAQVEIRLGDADDPLRGVVRIELLDGGMADVVVGKYQWQQGVIERADLLEVGSITVPVPRTSDLILLKLFAGGPQDLADIRAILESPDRDAIVAEVHPHLATLPEDCSIKFDDLAEV
jgi:hypothetical protein